MLLDPLPTVSDEACGVKSALKTLGLYPLSENSTLTQEVRSPSESRLSGTAVNMRNYFIGRRVRPRRGERSNLLSFTGHLTNLFRVKQRAPQRQSQHQDSTDPETALEDPTCVSGQASTHPPLRRSPSRLSGESARSEQTSTDESLEESDYGENSNEKIHTLPPLERSIFRGLLPRGSMLDYSDLMSFNKIGSLKQYLDTETSTAVDLAAWIRPRPLSQRNTIEHSGPLDFLFAIVQKDTLSTLRLMDLALTQIRQDSLDDTLIQQKLTKWRLLLEKFDAELRSLEIALSRFAIFIAPLKSSNNDDNEADKTPSPLVAKLLREGEIEIANLRHRATSSYKSLIANMSIVESKRSIAEAEGVTKLTELAFFFIPLTFSASIFSMQIKELNAPDISVSDFIILAIIITVLSYALRLLIRSRSFTENRGRWIQEIRSDAHLSPDASIPTTTFLIWIWYRLGFQAIAIVLDLGLIICPIAALWITNINRGLKAVVTVLLLFLTLSASYFMLKALVDVDRRGPRFRRKIIVRR